MKDYKALSFETFLHEFETNIISDLVKFNRRNISVDRKDISSLDKMLKVALRFFDKNLAEYSLAHGLYAALGPYSCSYGYSVGNKDQNEEAKAKLREFLDKHKSKSFKATPILDNLEEIVSIIATANYNSDSFEAGLRVLYDVCIRRELMQFDSNSTAYIP